MRTVVASRPDRTGTLSPPADGAQRGENRWEDLGARQSGQWNPTEAECMQRAQMRRSQRWHRTPARFWGCQWQTSASGGESIGEQYRPDLRTHVRPGGPQGPRARPIPVAARYHARLPVEAGATDLRGE